MFAFPALLSTVQKGALALVTDGSYLPSLRLSTTTTPKEELNLHMRRSICCCLQRLGISSQSL